MWIEAAPSEDVPTNATKSVTLQNKRILLVRSAAGLFALDDKCPHQEQSMVGGDVSEKAIECPWHSVKVELASGKILNDMGFLGMPPMKVYPVKEENGKILVDLPE